MDLKTVIQTIQDEINSIQDQPYMCYNYLKKAEYAAYLDGLNFALMQIQNLSIDRK